MQLRQRRLFGLRHRQAAKGGRQGAGDHRAGTGQKAAHRLDIAGQVFQRILQRQQAANLPRGGQDIVRGGRIVGKVDRRLDIEAADARPGAEALRRRRAGRLAGRGFAEAEMRLREEGAVGWLLAGSDAGGRLAARTDGQRAKVRGHQHDQAAQQRLGLGEEACQLAELPAREERQAGQAAQPQRAAHVPGQPVQPLKAEPGRMKEKVRRRMAHAEQDGGAGSQTDWG